MSNAVIAAGLRGGEYISDWPEGVHPYGTPAPCPFCGYEQQYTSLVYNGYGPPPSYMFTCGNCGAEGPHSHGRERDDHYGAREDAIRQWNTRAPVDTCRMAETRNEAPGEAQVARSCEAGGAQ